MIRRLIREAHRRSLWQVMAIYLGGSWVALQVVDDLSDTAGLPDWVPSFALVLLVIGLPIVVATAFVQEGLPGAGAGADRAPPTAGGTGKETGNGAGAGPAAQAGARQAPGSEPVEDAAPLTSAPMPARHRLLTWRNAIGGGIAAFTVLLLAVAAYFAMRLTGVGPVASLQAQGVLAEGEPILLAEFANSSNDPSLGGIVTEALRVDLGSSKVLSLFPSNRIADALRRMQRQADEPLTASLGREVAIREGVKAVLEGEVGSAGSGYIMVASLNEPETGTPLATFRRTAKSAQDVIEAIDRLSQDIREKAGESLRAIKAEEPLSAVTTSSLEALRKYVEAEARNDAGEQRRAQALLEEAIGLDPEFAMAWRKLAVVLQNSGGSPAQAAEAATKAWELRDRLTERERYLATAAYHGYVTFDSDAEEAAYETVLSLYPDDGTALNNLAIVHMNRTRYEEAIALLTRAATGPARLTSAATNLSVALGLMGRLDSARAVLEAEQQAYPDRAQWHLFERWLIESMAGNAQAAHAASEELSALPGVETAWRVVGLRSTAMTDAGSGRMAEARLHLREAVDRGAVEAPEQVVSALRDLARFEYFTGAPAAATAALRQATDRMESLRAEFRPWQEMALTAAELGDVGLAESLVQQWQSSGGLSANPTSVSEARRALAAWRAAERDPAAAVAELESLRRERRCPRCGSWVLPELEARAGRLERAAELWEDGLANPDNSDAVALRRALAHERLGEIYEQLGNPQKAAEHWAAFAEAWKDADPGFQPRVQRARDRLAALLSARG